MAKFAIVDFYKESKIDYVPLNWINGKKCSWPAAEGKSLTCSQNKLRDDPTTVPGDDWIKYPVRLLRVCGESIDSSFKL